MNFFSKKNAIKTNKKGATVLEMLICCAIIGMLTALSVTVFVSSVNAKRRVSFVAEAQVLLNDYMTAVNTRLRKIHAGYIGTGGETGAIVEKNGDTVSKVTFASSVDGFTGYFENGTDGIVYFKSALTSDRKPIVPAGNYPEELSAEIRYLENTTEVNFAYEIKIYNLRKELVCSAVSEVTPMDIKINR